jgi:hypothetical protein
MFTSIHVKISSIRFLCAAAAASLLMTCGITQAQTTVSYLQVPPSGNLAGALNDGPQVFNLPGYGNVGVTLTNPSPDPMPVTYFDQLNAYNEQTNNTLYNWGTDTQRFDMYNANGGGAIETYQFNFYFLSGAPTPADLYLVVDGLAIGTTATVSQPGTLVGEYTFPNSAYYPAGPSSTTLYGVAGPQTFSSLGDRDPLNTGWALWQPNGPVQISTAGAPTLSLDVSQIPGDGIGFTVGYATVPEPASLGLLAGTGLFLRRYRRQSV